MGSDAIRIQQSVESARVSLDIGKSAIECLCLIQLDSNDSLISFILCSSPSMCLRLAEAFTDVCDERFLCPLHKVHGVSDVFL